jgi:hypothetical protein
MPKIIISYRRSDSDAIAGRIRDSLASHYGEDSVYMDIDSVPFGIDFRDHIRDALFNNDILVAVVGPRWVGPAKGAHLRIKEENDPVRIEVETALERDIPVIPVLVNGAVMPKPSDLPAGLTNFAYRNAAEVDTGRDFHPHMDRLIRSMDRILQSKGKKTGASDDPILPPAADTSQVSSPAPVEPAPDFAQKVASTSPKTSPNVPSPSQTPMTAVGLASLPSTAETPAARPGKHAPSGLLIALAAGGGAVFAAAVAGVAIWFYVRPSPAPLPAPPPQVVAEQPKPPPQMPAPAPSSPATAPGCQSGTAAFYDNFKTPDPGWNLNNETQTFYANGQLVIKAEPDTFWSVIYRSLIYKNATICLDVKTPPAIDDKEIGGGVVFWAVDYANYYLVVVTTDGRYRISRKINGNWSTVTPITRFDGAKAGYGVVNHIKVTTAGNIATVYINDRKAQDIRGQPPKAGGAVGMYGGSEKGQVNEWRFLDIAVVELPASQTATTSPSETVTKAMLATCKLGPPAVFADDFKAPDLSWIGMVDDKAYYVDGRLTIKAVPNRVWEIAYWALVYKDVTVCADVKSPPAFKADNDTAGGIIFWATGFRDYYAAVVYPDGSYVIYRRVDGKIATVIPKTTLASINKGPGAQNRLKIALKDNAGAFYINDVKVRDFRGQPPADGGSIGLIGESETDRRDEWGFTGIVAVEP